VIGIEAAPHTTLTTKHPRHSLESLMDHVAYCIAHIEYVDGMKSPAEALPNAARWLVANGHSDPEIGKILGGERAARFEGDLAALRATSLSGRPT
jgi:membrane dipeptidase